VDDAFLNKLTDRVPRQPGVYIVGGTLRDLLLGHPPTDCDLVTTSDPLHYAHRLAAATGGKLVPLGKPGKMVYRVVTADLVYDICPVAGGSIETDLKRRDFTVNALALDVCNGRITDIAGGRADIRAGRIRMVSREALSADPLRMLRAFRIGAALGFSLEPSTMAAVSRLAGRITVSAPERIREELVKFFQTPASHTYLEQMAQSGLLFNIFPELKPLGDCRQNRHHRHDVWHHTLAAYGVLENLLSVKPRAEPKIWELVSATTIQGWMLKFATLIHDAGKPATRTRAADGAFHFHGHQKMGGRLAAAIADRLRCSSSEKERLCFLVEHHMRPMQLFLLGERSRLTPRALARFFVRCGQRTPDILLLSLADHGGKETADAALPNAFSSFIIDLYERFRQEAGPRLQIRLPISGHDLVQELGLSPSPLFATILAEIRKALLTGEVTDRDSALALAARIARRREGGLPRRGNKL